MPRPPKLLVIVLDGAADKPVNSVTPLSEANTPGLDKLAQHAICGFHYPIAPGVAPESDAAVLSLLGYPPDKYYTGRGPLEALGAGLSLREGWEVAFRANFATIDPATRRIIDRRVGRSLRSDEARELAKTVDGLELGVHGYARVKATIGHRAVVIIGSREKRLSADIQNIDPAYVRRGLFSEALPNPHPFLSKCQPLHDSLEARETCTLVDEFIEKTIEILDRHPINIERERRGLPKANAILLRDAGDKLPRLPPLSSITGYARVAAVVEMPVEVGIAFAAGMKTYMVEPPTGVLREDLPSRLQSTLQALSENDLVYVHLKGPDEPGHDGNFDRKKASIEEIDKYYIQPLLENIDLSKVAVLVTSDHATPWHLRSHSGDKVPWMLSHASLGKGIGKFSEVTCENLSVKTLEHGWQLLPFIVSEILTKLNS